MLADRLYSLESFQVQYEALLILSVKKDIPNLISISENEELPVIIDWNNLLGIASVLARSDKATHLDAALRIAQTTITDAPDEIQKLAAASVLLFLSNEPAVRLAINRQALADDYKDKLPVSLKIETNKALISNSVIINEKIRLLNHFQKKVYDSEKQFQSFSVSAPTSAGKSFILCNLIIDILSTGGIQNICYVVPTRSLISQVETDFEDLLDEYGISNVSVSTVPGNDLDSKNSNILIFTQERLHWFLMDNPANCIQILVIDEAQKVGDGYRGILLQQKIEQMCESNTGLRVFFSSPFTNNPESLLELLGDEQKSEPINTSFVAVNQNLIFVSQVRGKTEEWYLDLQVLDKSLRLGKIKLRDRPIGLKKKQSYIAIASSSEEPANILYANGANDAELLSLELAQSRESDVETLSKGVNELIDLVKKTIHKDYRLIKALKAKVAFHYGNMPLIVRESIENLFKEGELEYLVCTSTLLEGVNLPARSITILKPRKGNENPLDQNDFWNLAGRAGRWGKEFSGNIFCISPDTWEIKPKSSKSKQVIKKSVDEIKLNAKPFFEAVNEHLKNREKLKDKEHEYAFGYFYEKYLNGDTLINDDFTEKLHPILEETKKILTLPDVIIRKTPGISPIDQQKLYNYFEENRDRIEELIPVYPEDENAAKEYTKLIARIGKTINKYPTMLSSYRAILVVNWMSGLPISVLIKKAVKYWKGKKSLNTVIRDTMKDVENFVRFEFARDSSCYISILRYFLTENGLTKLLERIPDLSIWLEFGVSQKTHISLLSIGLRRFSAIEVAELMPGTDMNKEEVVKWLIDFSVMDSELPEIVKREISSLTDKLKQR